MTVRGEIPVLDFEYLLWLQNLRLSSGDFVQGLFSFLGSEAAMAVAMVIPCMLYWCYDKRAGQFALLSFSIGTMFNQFLKNTVCAYRPWVRDVRIVPDEEALEGAGGYSFPSGHAQATASVLVGLGFYYRKYRKRLWPLVLGVAFTLLVCFSRNFLGVHLPQDVVVGFIEGCLFAYLTWKLMDWVDQGEGRDFTAMVVLLALTLASLVYLTIKPYPVDYVDGELLVDPQEMLVSCYKSAGALVGTVIGWFLERTYIRFETGGLRFAEVVARVVLGAVLALAVYKLSGHLFESLFGEAIGELFKHALTFLMLSAGVPLLFRPLSSWFQRR